MPTGAAAVFERVGGTWTETTLLTVPGASCLGDRVSVDGEIIALGDACSKAVEVFGKEAGTWDHVETLEDTDAWFYGKGLDVDGDRIAVGDPNLGFVDIYESTDSGWARSARVGPADVWPFDWVNNGSFGEAVHIDGDTLLVGAPIDDLSPGPVDLSVDQEYPCGFNPIGPTGPVPPCVGPGAAYVFEWTGTTGWTQTQKLTSDQSPWDVGYGVSVALDDGVALVGDWYQDPAFGGSIPSEIADLGSNHGTAYIYENVSAPLEVVR